MIWLILVPLFALGIWAIMNDDNDPPSTGYQWWLYD